MCRELPKSCDNGWVTAHQAGSSVAVMVLSIPEGKSIVLFDGVCNVCNTFVNFVIDRDSEVRFSVKRVLLLFYFLCSCGSV